jgi:PAS domain S-box-containing protein
MPTILAIDDKRDNLTTITALLKQLMPDCTVITAQSGSEGIEKALAAQPDAVLLDINMPGMDGFETCRRLKADSRTQPIPVVMVTAVRSDAPSRVKGLDLGADAFLSKPIDEHELVSQIRVVLRIKAAENALRRERSLLETMVQERTASLLAREAFTNAVLEAIGANIAVLDRRGVITAVNGAWERFARENGDAAGGAATGVGADYLGAICAATGTSTEGVAETLAGIQAVLAGANPLFTITYPCHSPEQQRWFMLRATPLSGALGGAVVAHIDITAHKQAEEALRKSEAELSRLLGDARQSRQALLSLTEDQQQAEAKLQESKLLFETVVENIPLMVFLKEATDLRFVIFNRAGEELLGYDRKDFLGKNNLDLFPPEQAAHFMAKDREVLAGDAGSLDILEEPIQTAKKGERLLHTRKVCIRGSDGTTKYLLGISDDITERKRAADEKGKLEVQLRQAQKMEAVGRLAGGVAHDFNNLLMGIMGYAELCRDRIESGHPIREYLDEITRDAQRSAEITRQLLAFARKQLIEPKVLDLNDSVAGMLKLLRRLIGEDIHLAWRPGVDLRPVKLDPSQVDQILANLCVNARDAVGGVGEVTLETGSVAIDADACARHPDATPGAYVFLAVSDNGCGMDKETLAQIFEPFFTTKGLGKGTGLGLATVYGIVRQNNGFIYAYSEPGKGTTFKVFLPEIAAETVETTVTRKTEAPRGRGETILLVEDEKSLRVTCGLFLKALDYKVLAAETPGEALKMVAGHPGDVHVLLTDVVMPGMDGRQLAKRISAIKPSVKVLFMSGYTADVIVQRGVLDEGVQFLSKPFSRDDLARKVRELLEAD